MSSGKWWPFCHGLNVLNVFIYEISKERVVNTFVDNLSCIQAARSTLTNNIVFSDWIKYRNIWKHGMTSNINGQQKKTLFTAPGTMTRMSAKK